MPIPRSLGLHYDLPAADYFFARDEESKTRSAQRLLEKAERFSQRRTLLDVGSGTGEVAALAKSRGWTAVAIEPSAAFAAKIREKGVEVLESQIETVDLMPDSFDVAILAAVLEHLYHPARAIEAVARALRPDGIVFLDVPNERGLYFRVGNMYEALRRTKSTVNLSPTFAPYHVFGFSPVSLRKLLAEYGLQPFHWHVYAGASLLPTRAGIVGRCESFAAKLVTHVSRFGELGTYIEVWARKNRRL